MWVIDIAWERLVVTKSRGETIKVVIEAVMPIFSIRRYSGYIIEGFKKFSGEIQVLFPG